MTNLRDRLHTERGRAKPEPRKMAGMRAGAVVDQFLALLKAHAPDPFVSYGGVVFVAVESLPDGGVSIRTAPDATEDDFRIFNPPTLVHDPQGDIELHGRRYREDPLAAVAQVILGARESRKGRRR